MENPIILALDFTPNWQDFERLVDFASQYGFMGKIGLGLITRYGGPRLVRYLHKRGVSVFYDGKFDDIGTTVAEATKAAADLGVTMFTLHASVGAKAMRTAAKVKGSSKMLAVTVLTSKDARDMFEEGYLLAATMLGAVPERNSAAMRLLLKQFIPQLVMLRAMLAGRSGSDGIVCSGRELCALGANPKTAKLIKVVPGVRSYGSAKGNQKRVVTPAWAMQNDADYLVIGRPITQAKNPRQAAKEILRQITER